MITDKLHKIGGNYFDKMRIDLDVAFEAVEDRGTTVIKKIYKPAIVNLWHRFIYIINKYPKNRWEPKIITGMEREWFDEFYDFWSNFLGGRPLNVMDFNMLRMQYRLVAQHTDTLDWSSKEKHAENWKQDENMAILFQQVYNSALRPYREMRFMKKNMHILEYGCSNAPYYRSYRRFYSHYNAKWTLADLKQISFLYAKYSYGDDDAIEKMIVIDADNMDNPFGDLKEEYDLVILTTVLEHLHEPLAVVKMLLSKLKSGGILMFDYLVSHAKGLDSTNGLIQRKETIKYIANNTKLMYGDLSNIEKDISLCYAMKQ